MGRFRPHLLTILLVLTIALSGLQTPLRDLILDARFKVLSRPATGDVVLIEIDPRSIEAIGRWPWLRGEHARLLRRLGESEVAEVVFDVDFSAPSAAKQDALFAAALAGGRLSGCGHGDS